MKKPFADEQIIGFLKQVQEVLPVRELCSDTAFPTLVSTQWRAKLAGRLSRRQKLRNLEAENAQLEKPLAERLLDEALNVTLVGSITSTGQASTPGNKSGPGESSRG